VPLDSVQLHIYRLLEVRVSLVYYVARIAMQQLMMICRGIGETQIIFFLAVASKIGLKVALIRDFRPLVFSSNNSP
jgi:hypothetical protein